MTRYQTPRLLCVGLVSLVVELTAAEAFSLYGARVELILILACFAALFARDGAQAAMACWSLGLVKDLGSVAPLGWHALLFVLAGGLLAYVRQLVFREHILTQCAVAAAGALVLGLAGAIWTSATVGSIPAGLWLSRLASSMLLTGLAAPILFAGLREARFTGR